jgi:hypothetical protein
MAPQKGQDSYTLPNMIQQRIYKPILHQESNETSRDLTQKRPSGQQNHSVSFILGPQNNDVMGTQTAADRRQEERLQTALAAASATLGTYTEKHRCTNNVDDFIPDIIQAPEDEYYDENIINTLEAIIQSEAPHFTEEAFHLEFSTEAARYNNTILQKYDYDIQKCMMAHPNSIVHPGLEFRHPAYLAMIYRRHSSWAFVRHTLEYGAEMYRHTPINHVQRKLENQALIKYNNHKAALDHADLVTSTISDDIAKGFAIARRHDLPGRHSHPEKPHTRW